MNSTHPAQRVNRLLVLLSLVVFVPALAPRAWAAGSGSVRLDARPNIVLADGHSTATIQAVVRDSGGNLVADGTQVRFTTTAGSITDLVLSSAGAARATLTSSSLPSVAEVSAYAEGASATVKVEMVATLAEISHASPVVSVEGKYVAYSEALRIIEAMDHAQARFQGLRVQADAVQVDLSRDYLRARGSITLQGRGRSAEGERLLVNLRTLQMTLLGREGKKVFQGRSLTELPKPYPAETESFEFVDLSESEMLWTAKEATAVLGQKVQLRRATAYLVGARVLPLAYHEIRLDSGGADLEQYVGVGTQGLVVDVPYFIQMAPSGSTAFRLRHQYRSGFGWYGTDPGWELDLEHRYGIPGQAEGTIDLGRITGSDWGVHWDHTQQFGAATRLYTFFDFPAHRDLFGQINFYRKLGFGALTVNLSGNKLRDRSLARSSDIFLESNAHPIGKTGASVSLEGRLANSSGVQYEDFLGHRLEVPGDQSRELGLKLRPPALRLGPKTSVGTAVSLRQVWGSRTRNGLSIVGNAGFSHGFGQGSVVSLNYNYNDFTGSRLFRGSGKHTLSGSFILGRNHRLRVTSFGILGLDSPLRSFTSQLGYRLTPSWRLDLQSTAYRFRSFTARDLQLGFARKVGDRELQLFYSTDTHRFTLEVGASSF